MSLRLAALYTVHIQPVSLLAELAQCADRARLEIWTFAITSPIIAATL